MALRHILDKIVWVNWDKVCLPKEEGCLGVEGLKYFNISLLCKWKWHYLMDINVQWYDFLCFRYSDLAPVYVGPGNGSTLINDSLYWKDLVRGFEYVG